VLAGVMSSPGRRLGQLLRHAIPGWAERLRSLPPLEFEARRGPVVDIVAHRTDVLYGGAKPGQVAAAFNAMAEGLAMLTLSPGGPERIEQWLTELEAA